MVLDEGKTVGAVARELDLTASSLGVWVRQAEADRSKGKTGLTTAEREELARLTADGDRLTLCKAEAYLLLKQRGYRIPELDNRRS